MSLKKEGYKTKFILAGDGDVEHYRRIVKEKGIDDQMEFIGPKPASQIAELMRYAKVFVFPTTTQEGHPKSLIEALASGCPCVVTKVLGNTEVVQEKFHNGISIEPNNQKQLNDAVRQVLDNEDLRKSLKKNAVISAQKFDIVQVVKHEIDIIEAIIKRK